MKTRIASSVLLVMLALSFAVAGQDNSLKRASVEVHDYDPARSAEQDVRNAIAEAKGAGKHVLLEVGGKWCIWCRIMDSFFEKNPDLTAFRDRNYITVKINYSPENQNQQLLSRYPKIDGYPHIFVLDQNGDLLHSQNTGDLESGRSYDLEKFFSFLKKWAPQSK
jgi:thiol:disulfide interchange protein